MKKYAYVLATAFLLSACGSGGSETGDTADNTPEMTSEEKMKYDQYMVAGETLYLLNCSQCHNAMGTGLGELYPPLKESDYMENNFEEVICILKYGKSGEIVVNGKTYNQVMPPQPQLSSLEIAEIATYIYNSWGHTRGLIPVTEVEALLAACEQE